MPLCPYCQGKVTIDENNDDVRPEKDVREVRREVKGTIKKEVMYSCPHCDRVLGFGYFMGGLLTGRP